MGLAPQLWRRLPEGLRELVLYGLASAAALGEKYRIDAPHARSVAHLAVRLFDELRAEHGLSAKDRLLLEVAAPLAWTAARGSHAALCGRGQRRCL